MDLSKLSDEELLALRARPQRDLSGYSDEQLLSMRQPPANPQQNQPQTYGSDILETALPGLFRGANAIAGMPGDISQLARSGINAVMGPGTVEPHSPTYPTSQEYQQALEKHIGFKLYEPKTLPGKIVNRTAEYAPAAIGAPETLLGVAGATAVPAAAGVLAGEGAKAIGLPSGVQKGADLFATLLAPYAFNKMVNSIATLHARELQVPSTSQRKSITDATYAQGAAVDAQVPPEKLGAFLGDVATEVQASAHDIKDYNKPVANMLGLIGDTAAKQKGPVTIAQLHKWREIIAKDIGKPSDNGGLARWMYGQLTDFMYNPENYIGEGQKAVDLYKAGDESFKLLKNSQLMDQYWRQSENRLANYSQAGFATGVRQKFRGLADRMAVEGSKESRFYGPELQAAAERVAQGTTGMNMLREASKWAPWTLKGAGSMLGANYFGGPYGAAVTGVLGSGGKLAFELGTLNEARRASDLFRLGHELNVPGLLSYPGLLPFLAGSQAQR